MMRTRLFLTALLSGLCLSLTHAQTWQLYWSDEFNAASLSTSDWNVVTGNGCPELCGFGNNELQYYTGRPENLKIENGKLIIQAKKETYQNHNYTSARIHTKNKVDFTYGKIEAMIKLPEGKGIWPAFWMLPTDNVYGGWPESGEIDIMEMVGHQPSTVHGTIHYGDPWPNNKNTGGSYTLSSGPFSQNFHLFTIEWEPGEIRWYVDSNLYSTKKPQDIAPYNWPFDQDFYILLNCAVGGNWPGNPDASTVFPQTMEIDYVRVYQRAITSAEEPLTKTAVPPLIYPNPVRDYLSLVVREPSPDIQITITNTLGQEMAQRKYGKTSAGTLLKMDCSFLPPGLYLVSVTTPQDRFTVPIARH